MILITAAAYVPADLAAEFGQLPPAFLPVGNRRLFAWQLDRLAPFAEPIALSVPTDFDIEAQDQADLDRAGVQIVRVPPGLSLGRSVATAIAALPPSPGLRILHGDTLIDDLPVSDVDVFSVGTAASYLPWSGFTVGPDDQVTIDYGLDHRGNARSVLSGYFSFADRDGLGAALSETQGDFIAALNRYAHGRHFRPVTTGDWLDLGNVQTYYRSKARVAATRSFNVLHVAGRSITKTSRDGDKIAAEAAWYASLPAELRLYVPALLMDRGADGYSLERLHLPTLTDLFVFGRLPGHIWAQIFDACDEFLGTAARHPAPADDQPAVMTLYRDKTLARLARFARDCGIDINRPWTIDGWATPGLRQIVEQVAQAIPAPTADLLTVVHGDFCFSNLFYDFRTDGLRLVDPRGRDGADRQTIFGDRRYDLAKLHHSAIGGYDLIMAGRATVTGQSYDVELQLAWNDSARAASAQFAERRFAGLATTDPAIAAISILLFLSMLPLHAEAPARQRAFIANALRLFRRLDGDAS